MAKFGNPDPTQEPAKPTIPMDEREPASKGAAAQIDNNTPGPSRPPISAAAAPQLSEAAQLAALDCQSGLLFKVRGRPTLSISSILSMQGLAES